MKKNLSLFVTLVLMSSVTFAGGIEDPITVSKMTVVKTKNGVFNLTYRAPQSSFVEVAIYNQSNELLYSEKIKGKCAFSRPYNFSNLAHGDYNIVVKDGNKKLIEKVSHLAPVATATMHVVRVQEGRFLLTLVDNHPSTVTILIANKNNVRLFTKQIELDKQYAQLFNFPDKLDTYTFSIVREDDSVISLDK